MKKGGTYRVGCDESGHAVGDFYGVAGTCPGDLHPLDVKLGGGPLGGEVIDLDGVHHGHLSLSLGLPPIQSKEEKGPLFSRAQLLLHRVVGWSPVNK
jgi:hypothetical protein